MKGGVSSRHALLLGVVFSLVVHGGLGAALRASAPQPELESAPEPEILVDFEVPAPPAAELPIADRLEPRPAPLLPPEPDPGAGGTIEPEPEPEPEPELATLPPDAGVAMATAGADAGVDDGGVTVVTEYPDAGAAAVATSAPVVEPGASVVGLLGDAGAGPPLPIASGGELAGTSAGPAEEGEDRTPGTHANLLAYMPEGEVLTLLLRMDRLRGSEWAARTEAIFAWMPDYRTLIGDRDLTFSAIFDTLVISSFEPSQVDATTVVVRTARTAAELRDIIDHPGAPVTWSAARGGALGTRTPTPLVQPGDPRVFLMPYPGWAVLTRPTNLGGLTGAGSGDLDSARAPAEELPVWLRRLESIEQESGQAEGPFFVLTATGVEIPPETPLAGDLPSPLRLTLAMQQTRGGFLVRGTLLFPTEAAAARFAELGSQRVADASADFITRKLLQKVNAYNALRGLTFAQRGRKVGYATSIDAADGRAMMQFAARWAEGYYAARERERELQRKK